MSSRAGAEAHYLNFLKRVPLINFTLFPAGPNDPGCPIVPVLPYAKKKLSTGSS